MKKKILEVENITKSIESEAGLVTLVRDISFTVNEGEFITITGPSGSGKSSLVYLLGLLDRPDTGRIMINGLDTNKISEEEREKIRLEKIGFVFQFHFLLPEFTIFQNIMLPMRKLGKLSDKKMEERVKYLLNHFGLDKEKASDKYPHQISGGQRQRTAVARALANEPAIILADEPTGNLDTKNANIIFNLFDTLSLKEHKTIIAITHDIDLAAVARREIGIVDGKIVKGN
jgi:lipoprotein-releasing system ATP-binding protein